VYLAVLAFKEILKTDIMRRYRWFIYL